MADIFGVLSIYKTQWEVSGFGAWVVDRAQEEKIEQEICVMSEGFTLCAYMDGGDKDIQGS